MTAPALLIVAERCRLCRRSLSPSDLLCLSVKGGWKLCENCYHWQRDAMMVLAGKKPPIGCAECGRGWNQVQSDDLHSEQKSVMYLHALEGIYVLLCRRCSDRVSLATKERTVGTPEGVKRRIF